MAHSGRRYTPIARGYSLHHPRRKSPSGTLVGLDYSTPTLHLSVQGIISPFGQKWSDSVGEVNQDAGGTHLLL